MESLHRNGRDARDGEEDWQHNGSAFHPIKTREKTKPRLNMPFNSWPSPSGNPSDYYDDATCISSLLKNSYIVINAFVSILDVVYIPNLKYRFSRKPLQISKIRKKPKRHPRPSSTTFILKIFRYLQRFSENPLWYIRKPLNERHCTLYVCLRQIRTSLLHESEPLDGCCSSPFSLSPPTVVIPS